jgi:hypothetical protein
MLEKLHTLTQWHWVLDHARSFVHHGHGARDAFFMMADAASTRASFVSGVRVRWFDGWHPALNEALDVLPEMEMCPHAVFRAVATTQSLARKRFALVMRDGEPIAVAGVRRRQTFWEPLLEECIPFDLFPARPRELGNVLRALGLEISMSGYDADPSHLAPHGVTPYTIYRADLRQPFEDHWRKEDRLYTVRKARKRTANLSLRWDHPSDVDWIVRTWIDMWKDHPAQQTLAGNDRLVASRMLAEKGLLHSVALVDGDEPVAGATHLVQGKKLLFHCNARDRTRAAQAVGTRVLDETFHWAAQNGFESFDLGGGMDYKRWWAPPAGERYHLNFRPPVMRAARRFADAVRGLVVGRPGQAAEEKQLEEAPLV